VSSRSAKPPGSIAIIMDGNGRWAKKRGLPRAMGHREGAKRADEIIRCASEIGLDSLVLYAFSTENWRRPQEEIGFLMGLLKDYLIKKARDIISNNIRFMAIGERHLLPADVMAGIVDLETSSVSNTGMNLALALSYGSRQEIVEAARRIASRCISGGLKPEDITEKIFSDHLYTSGLPDPDLIIRTSGESRLSNFLLFQAAYSELYITETLWPDFGPEQFLEAISIYSTKKRRFGMTSEQLNHPCAP